MSDVLAIRELEPDDLPEMANILAEGFPRHSLAFWQSRLAGMARREYAPNTPLFGYGIDDDGLQGVALTFGSLHGPPEARQTIVNISSWTVRPSHRGPAAKELYRVATSGEGVTFSNLSAAVHTQRTIKNFGFVERTAGQMVAIGFANSRATKGRIVRLADAERAGLSPERVAMMSDHQAGGCLTFCLATSDRLAPLMFLPRRVKPGIPVAQLIYCERMSDVIENSMAVTLEIAKHGFVAAIFDASGPIEGLMGRYYHGKAAKYYKGPLPPHDIDHSYSEMLYIGP